MAAGLLRVSLTAEQSQFNAGMKSAAKSLEDFSKTVKESHGHMEKFNAHMLTSRHAMQTFAGIGSTAASPIMHMVHAFEVLPGPAGLALGAIYLLKEAWDSHAESVKKAREEQDKLHESIKKGMNIEETYSAIAKVTQHLNALKDSRKKGSAAAEERGDAYAQLRRLQELLKSLQRDDIASEKLKTATENWKKFAEVMHEVEGSSKDADEKQRKLLHSSEEVAKKLKEQVERDNKKEMAWMDELWKKQRLPEEELRDQLMRLSDDFNKGLFDEDETLGAIQALGDTFVNEIVKGTEFKTKKHSVNKAVDIRDVSAAGLKLHSKEESTDHAIKELQDTLVIKVNELIQATFKGRGLG